MAENPSLRVVGAHLGSMEADVDQVARRFDRYPNFAVDTAARVPYFMLQPREKVRAFLIKYQDRILYATDLEGMPKDDTANTLQKWTDTYRRDWKFFSTDQTVESWGTPIRGFPCRGPCSARSFTTTPSTGCREFKGGNRLRQRSGTDLMRDRRMGLTLYDHRLRTPVSANHQRASTPFHRGGALGVGAKNSGPGVFESLQHFRVRRAHVSVGPSLGADKRHARSNARQEIPTRG